MNDEKELPSNTDKLVDRLMEDIESEKINKACGYYIHAFLKMSNEDAIMAAGQERMALMGWDNIKRHETVSHMTQKLMKGFEPELLYWALQLAVLRKCANPLNTSIPLL